MKATDFAQFMQEIHGNPPFSWQSTAVEETLRRESWPATVDVPTGLGKTAMLDAAVFLLAMSVGGEAPPGLGRRRIYLVVDRRIVVDQAYAHGQRIAHALEGAQAGTICWQIAQRLRSLSGAAEQDSVLRVVKMRGGTTWDAAWLTRPDLPAIVTGTVDQVGSRLFFRGYGVSQRRRPIDAALVGTDSVIMIDEAHLAQALTAALTSARAFDTSHVLGLPTSSIIHLSATATKHRHGWTVPFDVAANARNKTAKQRLTAPKTLTFVDSTENTIVQDMVDRVAALADKTKARVLVVCNTVKRAREVYAGLTTGATKPSNAEVLLLMGRSRPLDRENITKRVTELFGADRPDSPDSAVVVATQTIEVGIDLDATGMITETAPWDSLVQRFGRVNRRGLQSNASVIVLEDCAEKPPVYGRSKVASADFLRRRGPMDVSPLALRRMQVSEDLVAPAPLVPVLLPKLLDAWTRTSPAPTNDPPIDPYLHGMKKSPASVTLIWRDGLLDCFGDPLPADNAGAVVDLLPIHSDEAMEIPLMAIRAWLEEQKPTLLGDVEDFDDIPFSDNTSGRMVLRRTGDANWQWVTAGSLLPGEIAVAPTEYGGLDRFGWNPLSIDPVRDLAELAALRHGQVALRIDPGLATRLGLTPIDGMTELRANWLDAEEPAARDAAEQLLVDAVRVWLEHAERSTEESPWTAEDLRQLQKEIDRAVVIASGDAQVPPVIRTLGSSNSWQAVDEEATAASSSLNRRVTLTDHLSAVEKRAARIAANLDLPEEVRRTVVDAARWHDLGKVDQRFQAMLFGGSAIAAEMADEPLAKSGMPPSDRQQHRRALQLSGLPRGARHEAWSEVIVSAHLAGLTEPYEGDADLLRHLVASHHGHGRPLLPPVNDSDDHALEASVAGVNVQTALPTRVCVSSADRFAQLNRKYGRWGLALLETIVRCADMTVSSEGS